MKQCPACNRVYDDSLSFCLMDGTPLTTESEENTVVLKQPPPPRKKGRFLMWFGLVGLIILAGIGLVVGILFYSFKKQNDNARASRQSGVNISSTPPMSSTPKTAAPSASPKIAPIENSSPQTEAPKPTPNDAEDSDDITPIAWDTSASGFKGEAGQTYTFRCPEQGTEHIVWGSDIYTQDSSICTAAVHAGIITLAQGGTVTIEFRPGRMTYGSTVRNGIKSLTYGEYPRSFVVR